MFKINVLRKMQYGTYWIHIFQFENVFQYFLSDNKGNLYQHYITMPTNYFRLLKFKLGYAETPFSIDQMELGEKIILSGAMTSIDAIIAKEEKHKDELRTATKIVNTLKKDPRCQWRAVELEDGMNYQCINHDAFVKMVDDVVPSHLITKDSKVLSPIQFAKE